MTSKQYTTTYKERFAASVAIMVGKIPPADIVDEWIDDVEVNGVYRLQDWVGMHLPRAIEWAQCIVLLDAAHVLAAEPEEGVDHEPWQNPNRLVAATDIDAVELTEVDRAPMHADTPAEARDA